jgi:Ca2+-binding RTX toxin-like protein
VGVTITLSGQSEAFTLTGSAQADSITGGSGNDIITGGAAADTLAGGAGDDTFNLASGDFATGESISGGSDSGSGDRDRIVLTGTQTVDFSTGTLSGIETLTGSGGADTVTLKGSQWAALLKIDLAGGTDILNVKADGDISGSGAPIPTLSNIETGNLIGTSGTDTITLSGGQLDAILIGSGTIDLGSGSGDTINLTSTSADLNTLGGTDGSIQGVEAISASGAGVGVTITLSGQSEAFTLTGSAQADSITGGSGNDIITGGAGNDTLNGGGGVDTVDYSWTSGGVNVNLALGQAFDITGTQIGTDTLSLIENVLGGSGDDTIVGDAQENTLEGGGGIDRIWGGAGNDTIYGNAGNDILVGGFGGDTPGSGNDTLYGGEGDDQLFGEDGNDVLWGGIGADQYAGGAGNDTLYFEADGASDIAWGGAGSDTFVFMAGVFGTDTIKDFVAVGGADVKDKIDLSAFGGVTFANLNIVQVGDNVEITSAGFGAGNKIVLEILNAGAVTADDFIFAGGGGSPGSTINGNSNNNNLTGTANDDTINGNGGNDTLAGLAGADVLNGGSGTDTATYAASPSAVFVSLWTGTGTGGHAQGDSLIAVENLVGSSHNDTLEGSSGANNLNGGGGIDTLTYINAGAGVTVSLALTSAQNTGGAGTDTISNFENLTGSNFNDNLTGNSGANVIDGRAGTDTITTGGGDDTVIFRPGYGSDTITDFVAGGTLDKIDLSSFSGIYSLADLLAVATQSGSATIINLSGTPDGQSNDRITLNNVNRGDLTANDFIFAPPPKTGAVPTNIGLSASSAVEGAAVNTVVGTLSTVDTDIGQTYTYSLIDSAGGRFGINGNQLVVTGPLNYEAGSTINVTVRVTDSGYQTFDKVFTISLLNVAPTSVTDTNAAANTIAENAANGTVVAGLAITSNDPNGGVTYSLLDNAGGRFAINATTGVVTVANGLFLDYETLTSHTITVKAEDSLGSATANFTIAVTDVAGPAINGNSNRNTLVGTNEGETINGNGGNDTLRGLGGADTLNGGTGADTMRGGAGNDNYIVDNANDVVDETADGGNGTDTVQSSITFSLSNTARVIGDVENLTLTGTANINATGNNLANVIIGNSGANNISGLGGADTLNGGSGNDTINGGDGDDLIIGGPGNDNLNGGNDTDTVSYETATGGVTVSLAISGAQNVGGGAGSDTLSNFENLTGSNFNDTLTGDGVANVLNGLAGNDTLIGGAGNDRLIGGLGTDTLTGGADADTFVFTAAVSAQGMDTITDFASGVDSIEVLAAGFGGGLDLGSAILVIGDGPPASPAAEAYFFYDNTGPDAGRLYFVPESGAAFAFAQLTGAPTLLANDIHII